MKWSKYNIILENGNNGFLMYNCASRKLMIILSEINDLINDNISRINRIEAIHPDFYKHLSNNGFIVEDDCDEVQAVIERIKRKSNNPAYFGLTLNPTLNCNLRCWYCYETLIPDSYVTPALMDSLKLLIRSKVENQDLRRLKLSFFGGEPLLEARKTILPLLGYAKKLCDANSKEMTVGTTTNGVLLSPKLSDELYNTAGEMSFQVPFDGNKLFHDKVKSFANGHGTYSKVVDNIKYALTKGFGFNLRCNYTPENVSSFKDLIAEFKEDVINFPDKIMFSFQKVWQTNENEETLSILEDLRKMANEINADSSFTYNSLFSPCYADMEYSVVVNYNGDIYNCTARDFKSEDKEGTLASDGTIIYNQKHTNRMSARFTNKTCLKCKIFPICDICSQKKLDNTSNAPCLRGATEDDIDRLLISHIQMVAQKGE